MEKILTMKIYNVICYSVRMHKVLPLRLEVTKIHKRFLFRLLLESWYLIHHRDRVYSMW